MERVLLADPKGVLIRRLEEIVDQKGCSKEAAIRRSALKKFGAGSETRKEIKESVNFRQDKPYGEDTVFGYVAVLDYKMLLKEVRQATDKGILGFCSFLYFNLYFSIFFSYARDNCNQAI